MRNRTGAAGGLALALLTAAPAAGVPSLEVESAAERRRPTGRSAFAITIDNPGPPLEGRIVVEQPGLTLGRRVELPVRLPESSRKRFFVSHDGRPGGEEFDLRLESDGRRLVETRLLLPSTGWVTAFVGCLGPEPAWLLRARSELLATTELRVEALPHDSWAWPDLDVIVWPAPRTSDLDPPRAAALRRWVERGGRLVAGTAADQPRALEELGWPPSGPARQPLGLGTLFREPQDLSRRPPSTWTPQAPPQAPSGSAAFSQDPLSALALRLVEPGDDVPPPPLAGVALVLGAWMLVGGPIEVWWQRRSARKGRRVRLGFARHLLASGLATALVLTLTGSFHRDLETTVRLDLVDVAEDGSGARGRSLVLRRARSGGWDALSTDEPAQVRPWRLDLEAGPAPFHRLGGLHEGRRVSLSGTSPAARTSRVRTLRESWGVAGWTVDFEPPPELVERARRWRTESAGGWSAPGGSSSSWSRSCLPDRERELTAEEAAACGAYSVVGERHVLQHALVGSAAVPPWPEDSPARVLARPGSVGPELQLNGEPLRASAHAIVRIRLREEVTP